MVLQEFVTKDTGLGRENFETGSVRDKRSGKGRFDLVPWIAIQEWKRELPILPPNLEREEYIDLALELLIKWFHREIKAPTLGLALAAAAAADYGYGPLAWEMIERYAKLMERGAEKYGDRNWELGQPLARFFDSGVRHLYQFREGLNGEEDHLAAVFYNVGGIIYTSDKIAKGELSAALDDRLPNGGTNA